MIRIIVELNIFLLQRNCIGMRTNNRPLQIFTYVLRQISYLHLRIHNLNEKYIF